MNKGYLARLGTFTHVEIKALALAGLVLLDGINAGRIVASDSSDAAELAKTIALIDAGYALQDAIHGGHFDLPVVMRDFDALAEASEIGVRHG